MSARESDPAVIEEALATFAPLSQLGLDSLHGVGSDGDGPLDKPASDTDCNTVKGGGLALHESLTRATDIASRAADLVGGDRDRQHGQKHDNFVRIAELWQGWLAIRRDPAAPLGAHDVGVMMALMKLARTQSGALNIDDYVDACGYAACAGEVAQSA